MCALIPSLRQKIHFFDQSIRICDVLQRNGGNIEPFREYHQTIDLVAEGKELSDSEKSFIAQGWDKSAEILTDTIWYSEKLYLVHDVCVLGHTGTIIYKNKIIQKNSEKKIEQGQNYSKAAWFLEKVDTLSDHLYFSALGVPKGHKHFYHFFIDYLAAVYSVLRAIPDQQSLSRMGHAGIIILVRDDLTSFQQLAYNYIEKKYNFIKVQKVKASQVLPIEDLIYLDTDSNVHNTYLMKDYIKFLHEIFASEGGQIPIKKKFYISRCDAKNRNIANEPQITEFLSSKQFETVYPAQLPLEDQIAIYKNADIIIAGAGAALTNLIYCQSETRVVIFYPKNMAGSQYLWLAKSVGIKNVQHIITDEPFGRRLDYDIPIKVIEELISDQ
jgi:hypothetical protein